MERQRAQAIIVLSRNVEEADSEIIKFLGNVSTKEKIAFLRGMFYVQMVSQAKDDETNYFIMLSSILVAFEES